MFDYWTLFESSRLLYPPFVNWILVRYLQKYFHDFILQFYLNEPAFMFH